jgi:hypothetical protein
MVKNVEIEIMEINRVQNRISLLTLLKSTYRALVFLGSLGIVHILSRGTIRCLAKNV